ncbi:hypothetical protein AACH06_25685 [Ideonella sp. DXS29W]|uniref:Uncharacterized protein n=1 Tax=Ideonella lacteola TaxID=2984193 RepID=A0ABU9BZH7_9BURK
MAFRVYVRWPGQRVTHQTTTACGQVAAAAYSLLQQQAQFHGSQGALGIALTENGRQRSYLKLAHG